MELRWDGVRSLADAMRMLKERVERTPAAHRPRVGFFYSYAVARLIEQRGRNAKVID
jgi:predicted amidohydrolase YtcJ